LKDSLQPITGNADSGVRHGELKGGFFGRLPFGIDGDNNFPGVSELDGVSHQVGQHLSKSHRVAHKPWRDHGRESPCQLQTLFAGTGGECLERIADQLCQIELDTVQLQSARFDLREIEDIVQEIQERLR
jgi:hypothetical protein